jgi:glutamate synthase domain-containing protein 2
MIFLYFAIAIIAVTIVFYMQDIHQNEHTIRKNFPVLGRIRYGLERLGVFLRQYLYANDEEEKPFNRITRAWVYESAKGKSGTIGFGSETEINRPGTILFVNSLFPTLDEERTEAQPLTIGGEDSEPFVVKRIVNISGMSYGALSAKAIESLSFGAKAAEIWLNTGEGGLSSYHLRGGCDLIFQIGTAKYGVRNEKGELSLESLHQLADVVKAFEIKLSQGAKPGKGGILPKSKVTPEIAAIRGIPMGFDSKSPNRHLDIATPKDLLQMIATVRKETRRPVGIKLVCGAPGDMEELCRIILQKGADYAPDFVTLDGGEGGSGAAPKTLADSVGLSIFESLPWLIDTLTAFGLKSRIKVIASGKLITPAAAAWAVAQGADFINTARGFLLALGCVQSLRCHTNTCPTGITTHNPRLTRGLVVEEKARRVTRYALAINRELDVIAHSCGLKNARELSREQARIVTHFGKSISLAKRYP